MINQTEICPKCNRIMGYDSYFRKHCCTNVNCGYSELIVHKNEGWIDELDCTSSNVNTVILKLITFKLNEIIRVLNKITNPNYKKENDKL